MIEADCDKLAFFVDGVSQGDLSGDVDWTLKQVTVSGAGNHTLLWRYSKDSSGSDGDDRGYVDYLQWSGAGPIEPPVEWQTVSYTYDPAGRRIEKKVDGTTQTKFVYDGDHIIAEYDGSNTLLRRYVHGLCIDEPVCLIEAAGDYAGTYYYHYDALGSVVALTDANADVAEFYEYSVYGQVAASDPNHPNRFMFTGREFDSDTGLYYYRARYYNPEIGRFLQTDPIGYGNGMNWHAYCGNCPTSFIDPSGKYRWENPKTHEVVYEGPVRNLPLYVYVPVRPGPGAIGAAPPVLLPIPTTAEYEGGDWTVQNFLWHYRYGEGSTLYFYGPDDPFVTRFRASEQISEEERRFCQYVRTQIAEKAAELAANGGNLDSFYFSNEFKYNVASKARFVWNLVIGNDPAAALYVLGHGTMMMTASGHVTSDGSYYVHFTFSVEDPFRDVFSNAHRAPGPTNPRSGWWQDCDDCTPFNIVLFWWIPLEIVGNISYP